MKKRVLIWAAIRCAAVCCAASGFGDNDVPEPNADVTLPTDTESEWAPETLPAADAEQGIGRPNSLQEQLSEMQKWGVWMEHDVLEIRTMLEAEREKQEAASKTTSRRLDETEEKAAALEQAVSQQSRAIESMRRELETLAASLAALTNKPAAAPALLPEQNPEQAAGPETIIAAAIVEAQAAVPPAEKKEPAPAEAAVSAISELSGAAAAEPFAERELLKSIGAAVRPETGLRPYNCALHVHTRFSSGAYDLPTLTKVAKKQGVHAVFLTDSWTETAQYGLPPLRHILWLARRNRSVSDIGVGRYVRLVEEENARQSDVLYVPGVELVPEVHWTGSVLEQNLTCHNHQKNLMVMGISDDGTIERLPAACGYVRGRDDFWIFTSRFLLALFAGLCAAFALLLRPMSLRSGLPAAVITRAFALVVLAPLLIAMAIFELAARRIPRFDSYGPDSRFRHEQQVLDALAGATNTVTFWAHPEASDHQEYFEAGIHFVFKTDPYPDILEKTAGYTGFAGVNEGANDLILPGALWDSLLLQYQSGGRKQPVWCFGEMLYHYEGQADKRLSNVQTVVWSAEKMPSALLAAMRKGAFYSRRNHEGSAFKLEAWRVQEATSGATAFCDGPSIRGALRVSCSAPEEEAEVIIVKNGAVVYRKKTALPFDLMFEDALPPDASRAYYRALVLGKYPLKLVTNPIFVQARR